MRCREFNAECVDEPCKVGCQLHGKRFWATEEINPPPYTGIGQMIRVRLKDQRILVYEVIAYDENTREATLYPRHFEEGDNG